jgi:peptidoglycan/xylan/chitin deacetylase (PgdA/CDA1 family)
MIMAHGGFRFSWRWRLLFLFLLLLLDPPPVFCGGNATVFNYHRFGDARFPSTNISLDSFEHQLEWLRQQKRPVLTLGEIARRLQTGEDLPEGCVALTVDDAYRSFAENGLPLLRRFGYPVTLFVNTGAVGSPDYLGWEELRVLAKSGVEIGNHSASHGYLLDRRPEETKADWLRRVREDILEAQRELTIRLGRAPRLFAYPYGEYSPELENLVRDLGFLAAAGQQSGVVWPGSAPYALPRFPMGGPYGTLEEFQSKAQLRALPVQVLQLRSPVLGTGDGAPALVVDIAGEGIVLDRMACFVQGENVCHAVADPHHLGRFTVQAEQPLSGRRNKYTLTAPGVGGGWYWFSQPWFRPEGVGTDGY